MSEPSTHGPRPEERPDAPEASPAAPLTPPSQAAPPVAPGPAASPAPGQPAPRPPAPGAGSTPGYGYGYGQTGWQSDHRGDPTTWATGDQRRPVGDYPGRQPLPGYPPPYGGWQGGQQGPVPSPAAGDPTAPSAPRRGVGRRLAELLVVALVAASLASAGTWALTRPATQAKVNDVTRQVEQADPNAPNWTTTASVVAPSVVSIRVETSSGGGEGSGVIIDDKAHIVTNNHVVSSGGGQSTITVALDDKRAFDAKIVGTDPATDLAVLQLQGAPSDLRPISLGDDTTLKVGDPVMAVGNPLGLSGTVTTGVVSALNRPVPTGGEGRGSTPVVTNAIQTSAAINPGNSGGALVNASGQLVGINSAIASLTQNSSGQGGNIGIGFAIPVNEVKNVTQQLLSTGKARHALLGVKVADAVVADGDQRRAAAKISEVVAGSAADRAGLKAGDAVVAVDGETVDGNLALVAQIHERQVGDQVTLSILRDGKREDVKVVLDEKQ